MCPEPTVTWIAPTMPRARLGVGLERVVPSPSCPKLFRPQDAAVPHGGARAREAEREPQRTWVSRLTRDRPGRRFEGAVPQVAPGRSRPPAEDRPPTTTDELPNQSRAG